MKKMLVILTLISGFVFSQDYEMPGLGLRRWCYGNYRWRIS